VVRSLAMKGTLKQFTTWCQGRPNGSGRHYSALNALGRFQLYLTPKEKEEMDGTTTPQEPVETTFDLYVELRNIANLLQPDLSPHEHRVLNLAADKLEKIENEK